MFQNVEVVFGQQIKGRIQLGGLPSSKAVRPMLNAKDDHQGAKQMKMGSNEVNSLKTKESPFMKQPTCLQFCVGQFREF